MNPLSIAAFLDGRLGHEKQTRGIIQVLERLTPVSVKELRLSQPPADGLRALAADGAALLRLLRPAAQQRHGTDLIIGTGARTHLPMLAYKRRHGGRVITCMAPDPLRRPWIDLCLVPMHDKVRPAANVLRTIGPPGTGCNRRAHDPGRGLLLIGGVDPKSHVWDSAALMEQVAALVGGETGLRWTISSSPRTPAEMVTQLAAFAAGDERTAFFDARETPPGWIEAAYDAHRTVWVTADSVSMVYEALTAGCRVGVLPVRWKRPQNKFQTGIEYLIRHQGVVTFDMWRRGRRPGTGPQLDEAHRCAEEILRHWWPNRLDPDTVISRISRD
ncbi:ELM1/GtrOC1 family putative glycosyltransferase [Desulfatitalea alkaliphila]|uniref:Mitochondrial fission ELM1 family protein n=1 Tax=Desulfatitalea alkaliphila TaxID=2929485 RepID=A0AA41R4P1_9BACT|nr:ELM1/GtrOC1 family putative glycosyltransferase [Desulfatitalea alkaliphila]MCJ8500741.1 mitochondrial fission ELM1 family protein [Desulfatitalea alkaliphila]